MNTTFFRMLRRLVWYKLADVSEMLISFIIRVITGHDR